MIAFAKKPSWQPNERDIAWAEQMVRIIKNEGTWCVPESGQIFQFYHDPKEIHLIYGDPKHIYFEQNKICFGKLGYTVLDKTCKV
jgi:hypothetical protein